MARKQPTNGNGNGSVKTKRTLPDLLQELVWESPDFVRAIHVGADREMRRVKRRRKSVKADEPSA